MPPSVVSAFRTGDTLFEMPLFLIEKIVSDEKGIYLFAAEVDTKSHLENDYKIVSVDSDGVTQRTLTIFGSRSVSFDFADAGNLLCAVDHGSDFLAEPKILGGHHR
jgi:hypothetical protein